MLSKAKICDCDKQGKPMNSGHFFVQFNPNEIMIEEACTVIKQGQGTTNDVKENEKQNTMLDFSTTLFYNTFTSVNQKEHEDVRGFIRKFYPYTNAGTNKKEKLKKICFAWGTLCIVGVLQKLSVKYTCFAKDGTPVRCEVTIKIIGNYYGEAPYKYGVKEEKVSEYDSFMSIIRTFDDPSDWKKEARDRKVTKARTA